MTILQMTEYIFGGGGDFVGKVRKWDGEGNEGGERRLLHGKEKMDKNKGYWVIIIIRLL